MSTEADERQSLVNALELVLAQVRMSFAEADGHVCEAFEAIADIRAATTGLCGTDQDALAQRLDGNIKRAVHALQFYDRLSQRLGHVEENLREVIGIVENADEDHSELWQKLQGRLRSVYSTEQEQALFCAFSGREYTGSEGAGGASGAGDVELF
ncbi:hypothetical protein Q4485_09375 [Granulosicoccaceae sp. 1_MG-2023]|nr:hypothetical protein [Granulosicoccaceae sp. 1_MG-2023]